MAGNGPVNTYPVFASDEDVAIRAKGDYWTLTNSSEQLAYGADGVFAPGSYWTMTSASVDFQAQGLTAQNVIQLTDGVPRVAPGSSGRMFAVDSVSPNTVVLRVIGKALGVGQPPGFAGGNSGVTFTCNTFASLLEDASWNLKDRFAIDEAQAYRASWWIYRGREDKYRCLRAATVLQAIVKAYTAQAKGDKSADFWAKRAIFKSEYDEVLERTTVAWGPLGAAEERTTVFSAKIAR